MPPRRLTASQEFARLYDQLVNQQSRVARAMEKHTGTYLRKRHVVGFGVGWQFGKFVPVFLVDRKIPIDKLAPKDRLPRSIMVGRRRVRTDVIAVGRPKNFAAIGDPTSNRLSYHNEGKGDWQMGTWIQTFARRSSTWKGGGTAGALVEHDGKPKDRLAVLTCHHVLVRDIFDVAQAEQNREPDCPTKAGTCHNFVGEVEKVLDNSTQVDAGLIREPQNAVRDILQIGAPKDPKKPLAGMWVQKSGAATGLTYGKIIVADGTANPDDGPYKGFGLKGTFKIENVCPQDPQARQTLPANVEPDKFAWHGDSGSLIVLGKANNPGLFGEPSLGLQNKFDTASAAEKQKIINENYGAALGLLVMGSGSVAYGQDISLVLQRLQVHLKTS